MTQEQALSISLIDIVKEYNRLTVLKNVSLEIEASKMVAVVGPSGCGKTTLLRIVGGFIQPDRGQILFNSQPVQDIPPERRPTSLVFQNYALWPHKTVTQNVAFGLQVRGWKRPAIAERVNEMLCLVDLVGLGDRYPGQLSGGQQQRVALARSLAISPGILLLDEPLSNLDAQIRLQMRSELRALQQRLGITTLYVTHDQEEALSIADRVVVLRAGVVEQYAPPKQVYTYPTSPFVAQFVGQSDLLKGKISSVDDKDLEIELIPASASSENAIGPSHHLSTKRHHWMSASEPRLGAPVTLAIKPQQIHVDLGEQAILGIESNIGCPGMISGQVRTESYIGTGRKLTVTTLYGTLNVLLSETEASRQNTDGFQPGQPVTLHFPPENVLTFAETES
jgi:ABC-type Fe3+/spermidine/putrescine transport system ATPase subunit